MLNNPKKPLDLFTGYGIELEFMIIDSVSLKVKPIADKVLDKLSNKKGSREVVLADVAWSNEFVKHVIELKSNGPAADLKKLRLDFYSAIAEMNQLLEKEFSARLLSTAMHPLFLPENETVIWQGEDAAIYASYDRIFNCKGHGWSNLQSIHINLPFNGDEQFGRLHAAVRVVIPLLPALAASSPFVEGKLSEKVDARLGFYSANQKRIPSIIGPMIPEAVFTRSSYREKILDPITRDIAPYDDDDVLEAEWLNSRTAIAKFEKSCIEIRVLDITECVASDLAIVETTVALVKALCKEEISDQETIRGVETSALKGVLELSINHAEDAVIDDPKYFSIFSLSQACKLSDVWKKILTLPKVKQYISTESQMLIKQIIDSGSLATRIRNSYRKDNLNIEEIYQKLSSCLAADKLFDVE